jgi:hypothetical protein
MRVLVLAVALTHLPVVVSAQSRPLTTNMTCQQAQNLVLSRNSVLLNTGPTTYDTFVSGSIGCSTSVGTFPAWVPTRDDPQCALLVCRRGGINGG